MIHIGLDNLPATELSELLAVLALTVNREAVHLTVERDTKVDGCTDRLGGGRLHASSLLLRRKPRAEFGPIQVRQLEHALLSW